ncbi:unnamed protein product [marine sediment metagenome]|uniref:Uncharacterized protein n=1 Tax=marine sediment metagenome TaxID=412755 RepID=X1RPB9_9ZZZZ
MRVNRLVAITWVDTAGTNGEHSRTEALIQDPITFTTYGRLLGRDKNKTTLASTEGWDDEQRIYRDITTFPNEAVKSIKEV